MAVDFDFFAHNDFFLDFLPTMMMGPTWHCLHTLPALVSENRRGIIHYLREPLIKSSVKKKVEHHKQQWCSLENKNSISCSKLSPLIFACIYVISHKDKPCAQKTDLERCICIGLELGWHTDLQTKVQTHWWQSSKKKVKQIHLHWFATWLAPIFAN